MSRVASKNTSPEIAVRSILHSMGYRFRLHHDGLPGTPDIVLRKHMTVVFVHGCFWHRHSKCKRATLPTTNREYWLSKFARTVARDKANRRLLRQKGWKVIVVWECELKNPSRLAVRFKREIG